MSEYKCPDCSRYPCQCTEINAALNMASESPSDAGCSAAELAAKEIYESMDNIEMESGQAGMYAQDSRVSDKTWINLVAKIIGKHCR